MALGRRSTFESGVFLWIQRYRLVKIFDPYKIFNEMPMYDWLKWVLQFL